MTVSISSQTQELLREQAGRLGEKPDALADTLLLEALRASREEYEETCRAITEGLADIDAGRTVSFEDARARWEQQKATRTQGVQKTA